MDLFGRHSGGSVKLRRFVAASPDEVFRAWTDPEEFMMWWRPTPYRTTAVEMSPQPGGSYRVTMQHPDGRIQYLLGSYVEVAPPDQLSMTWRLEGSEQDDGYDALLELRFLRKAGGTEIQLTHSKLPQRSMKMYEAGWSLVLESLDRHLDENIAGTGKKTPQSVERRP